MNKQKVWFTSDTHFGSERTLELSKRPFHSVKEMDESLIENWNSKVSDDDIVFHLGDFGNYEVSKKLKGKINLLYGNYERKDNLLDIEKCGRFSTIDTIESLLFTVNINDKGLPIDLILVHEPTNALDARNSLLPTDMILFGHIHGRQTFKKFPSKECFGMDVGVDAHHFYPISLDDVLFYKNACEFHYDEDVFI